MTKCKGCNITFTKTNGRQKFHNIKCSLKFFAGSSNKKSNKRNKHYNKSIFSYADRIKRNCLNCNISFMSEGKFNRICLKCKGKIEYAKGSAINVYL